MNEPIYLDTKSILVSTSKGIKRLNVPFLVLVCLDADDLKVGDKIDVTLVGFSKRDNLLYYLNNRYYKYYFFIIIDKRLL